MKLPHIDYAAHIAYGRLFEKPTLGLRARALARMAPSLTRFMILEARTLARRTWTRLGKRTSRPTHADVLRRDGIVVLRVGSNLRARIGAAVELHLAKLGKRLATIAPADTKFEDAQLVLARLDAPEVFEAVEEMLEVQGALDLVRQYLPGRGKVKAITLQWNRAGERHWSNKFADLEAINSTAEWLHVDTGSGVFKAIYYVSDEVTAESGAFSYVVGSNNRYTSLIDRLIRNAADRSGIGGTDREDRRMFNALPRFFQRKADFGFDVVDEAAEPLKARERVCSSADGNLILFDNFGMHRGGMVRKGERVILQIILW